MQVGMGTLAAVATAGGIGGGITAARTGWKAPVAPSAGSAEIALDALPAAAPGMALLIGGIALAPRGGIAGAAGAAMQLVGAAAAGFGFAAGTVGYFNWNR